MLEMSGVLHDADVLIDLVHAKGHGCCGYAGAIKNIAIGGYSANSRWNTLHGIENSFNYWNAQKCTPEHAQALVSSCPYEAIKYDAEQHKLTLETAMCRNELCFECLKADREVECLQVKPEMFSSFVELMAISAKKILKTFDKKKQFFLNFILEVAPHCDCMGMMQPCVVPDVGVVGSRDIAAIEQATIDLIDKAGIIMEAIPPYFKHANRDPNVDLHPFERIWGSMKSPYLTPQFAEKHGLGTRNYELVEVMSPNEIGRMKPPQQTYERQPSFF